mgnify:CR=1 FL=1
MHHTQPIRKLPSAIHQPFTRNQITFTRNETAPPPYSIFLPNGQNDNVANLKHCSPYGIPTTVIHQRAPDRTHAMPLMKPPKINQQILPNNRIFYSLSIPYQQGLLQCSCPFMRQIRTLWSTAQTLPVHVLLLPSSDPPGNDGSRRHPSALHPLRCQSDLYCHDARLRNR